MEGVRGRSLAKWSLGLGVGSFLLPYLINFVSGFTENASALPWLSVFSYRIAGPVAATPAILLGVVARRRMSVDTAGRGFATAGIVLRGAQLVLVALSIFLALWLGPRL